MKKSILFLALPLLFSFTALAEGGIGAALKEATEAEENEDETEVEEEVEEVKSAPKKAANTFRNTTWGASRTAVKASEKLKLLDESASDALTYEEKFLGYEGALVYLFHEDKLASATNILLISHTNAADFFKDYDKVKSELNKSYGTAKSENLNWENEEFKNSPDKLGEALTKGHVVKTANWDDKNSDVTLLLAKIPEGITLQVIYTIKDLSKK